MRSPAVCLIRDTVMDRQYGQADARAAKGLEMTASGRVSGSPVERALLQVGVDGGGQMDAGFRAGKFSPRRSIGPGRQRRRCV
jgi:hypothetical protein